MDDPKHEPCSTGTMRLPICKVHKLPNHGFAELGLHTHRAFGRAEHYYSFISIINTILDFRPTKVKDDPIAFRASSVDDGDDHVL